MEGHALLSSTHGTRVAPASKFVDSRYPVHQRIHHCSRFLRRHMKIRRLVLRSRSSRACSSASRSRPRRPRAPGSPVSATMSTRAAARRPARRSRGPSRRRPPAVRSPSLDPGGFGAVTITKSITISGVGANASILSARHERHHHQRRRQRRRDAAQHSDQRRRYRRCRRFDSSTGNALLVDDVRVFGFATGIQTDAGNTTINRSSFTNNRSFAIHGSRWLDQGRGHA